MTPGNDSTSQLPWLRGIETRSSCLLENLRILKVKARPPSIPLCPLSFQCVSTVFLLPQPSQSETGGVTICKLRNFPRFPILPSTCTLLVQRERRGAAGLQDADAVICQVCRQPRKAICCQALLANVSVVIAALQTSISPCQCSAPSRLSDSPACDLNSLASRGVNSISPISPEPWLLQGNKIPGRRSSRIIAGLHIMAE